MDRTVDMEATNMGVNALNWTVVRLSLLASVVSVVQLHMPRENVAQEWARDAKLAFVE